VSHDAEAYDSFKAYCSLINVPPMDYEAFCKTTQKMLPFNRETASEHDIRKKRDNVRRQGAELIICD
jgi:hypothetical protein